MAKERVAPGIYKVAGGVYDLNVSTGKGLDGKYGQATKRVRGTLAEAKAERGRMLAHVQDGKITATSDVSMSALHGLFMAARPKLAKNTRDDYDYRWSLLAPYIGTTPVRKLTAFKLDHAYAAVMGRGCVGANTTRSAHKHAKALLRQAMRWGLVARNVAENATPPNHEPFDVVPPSPEQIARLVQMAFVGDRQFGVLVHLAATTGARRGELAGVRWCDLDEDAGTIRYQWQPDEDGNLARLKTKLGRTVYLDDGTLAMLKEHREYCERIAQECGAKLSKLAFIGSPIPGNTEPFPPQSLSDRWGRLRNNAGIKCRLHDLRHAHASSLLNKRESIATVAERIGDTPTTVAQTYAHSDDGAARRAATLSGLQG